MEARIGSSAKAGQIAGNFNTLIMLRVKEVATAELLTDQLPEVHVVSTAVSSSVSDTNDPGEFTDFISHNEDRIVPENVRMLEPTDLVQLPKGQVFALIHGGPSQLPGPSLGHRGRDGRHAVAGRFATLMRYLPMSLLWPGPIHWLWVAVGMAASSALRNSESR